jgi:hypothetical protein
MEGPTPDEKITADTPIYDALLAELMLAKFIRKHGHKPGETPRRRLFKKMLR